MRDDQFIKLQAMSEKLTDVLFGEIDPDTWPAAGKPQNELTKDERGDRYWTKKNAAATLTLITKVQHVIGMVVRAGDEAMPSGETEDEGVDLDKEYTAVEREAARLLDEVEKQKRKREFDKRTLGSNATH
jgi:hypothetical protein